MAPRFVVVVFALLLAISGLCACERDLPPQLVTVTELTPREAEAGDHLELAGTSFPQGKKAIVTFRGTLHRPGAEPLAGAVVRADGSASSSEVVDVLYDDALQALFCGGGDRAEHTTFTGEVEVAFAAAVAGAPPIAATLHGVTLDLRPPLGSASTAAARAEDGRRALAFMGLKPGETSPAGGIVVAAVEPGSRAEQAGVATDDVIVALDGLRVSGLADLVPAPHEGVAKLTLRRAAAAGGEIERDVPLDGFRASAPVDLAGAAVVLVLAVVAALLFFAGGSAAMGRLELALVGHARAPIDVRVLPRGAASRARTCAVVIAVWLALAVPFAPWIVRADVDVGVALAVLATALVSASLFLAGPSRTWGAVSRGTLRAVTAQVLAAIAVAGVVLGTGSVRLAEIVRAQGGVPWEWQITRSPVAALLAWALLASAVLPIEDVVKPKLAEAAMPAVDADPASVATRDRAEVTVRARVLAFVRWGHASVVGATTAALFLGGWQVPGLAPGAAADRLALAAVGSALFLAKCALAILAVLVMRAALPRLGGRVSFATAWGRLVPLAAIGAAVHVAWTRCRLDPALEHLAGLTTFALLVLVALWTAARLRAPHAPARLNPFL